MSKLSESKKRGCPTCEGVDARSCLRCRGKTRMCDWYNTDTGWAHYAARDMEASIDAVQPEASTTLEQADSHALICSKLAEQYKSDPLLFAALTDAAAIIRDLLRELGREAERRWEGNRRAAQVCKDLDDEALAKESRAANGRRVSYVCPVCAASLEMIE